MFGYTAKSEFLRRIQLEKNLPADGEATGLKPQIATLRNLIKALEKGAKPSKLRSLN
jgi:hypothetical protein